MNYDCRRDRRKKSNDTTSIIIIFFFFLHLLANYVRITKPVPSKIVGNSSRGEIKNLTPTKLFQISH